MVLFERGKVKMYLCEDGHDEVCYDAVKCPVCEEQKRSSDLEDQIYDLKEAIAELKEAKTNG
jgi:transcription initiation factor IIE alpha subunit